MLLRVEHSDVGRRPAAAVARAPRRRPGHRPRRADHARGRRAARHPERHREEPDEPRPHRAEGGPAVSTNRPGGTSPSDDLAEYADGAGGTVLAASIEAHLLGCDDCRDLLARDEPRRARGSLGAPRGHDRPARADPAAAGSTGRHRFARSCVRHARDGAGRARGGRPRRAGAARPVALVMEAAAPLAILVAGAARPDRRRGTGLPRLVGPGRGDLPRDADRRAPAGGDAGSAGRLVAACPVASGRCCSSTLGRGADPARVRAGACRVSRWPRWWSWPAPPGWTRSPSRWRLGVGLGAGPHRRRDRRARSAPTCCSTSSASPGAADQRALVVALAALALTVARRDAVAYRRTA